MKTLRTFRAQDCTILSFYENARPCSQVTSLDIDQTILVSVDALVANFPSLIGLRLSARVNSAYEMLRLVVTYPDLEELAIRIADGHDLSIILMLIVRILKHLRELRINLTLPAETDTEFPKLFEKIFEVVLDAPTLRKFYINSDVQFYGDELMFMLPSKNRNCQVYWNGVLSKRV